MVMDNDPGARHPNGVTCEVEWETLPSDEDVDNGVENKEFKVRVFIQPELKLPKADSQGFLEWTKTEDVHPFWFSKRSCKAEDAKNMTIIYESVNKITTARYKNLSEKLREIGASTKVLPQTENYHVYYPCLVNTVPIKAGQELTLIWTQTKPKEKEVKRKKRFRPARL